MGAMGVMRLHPVVQVPTSAKAAWQLKPWCSQMDLVDEFETGSSLSLAQSTECEERVLDPEAHLAISSDPVASGSERHSSK